MSVVRESIYSVGIDVGDFDDSADLLQADDGESGEQLCSTAYRHCGKEVIYKSRIYFTPLLTQSDIDAEKLKEIVRAEYQAAGMTPADLKTGAVIITGETARKKKCG